MLSGRSAVLIHLILAALVISGAAFYIIFNRVMNRSQRTALVLVVRDSGSDRVYGQWALNEGEEFAIEFIHSVNQSPVTEFFRIENGMIRSFAVRFSSFGAGMQSDFAEGQTFSRDGDAVFISGLNASFRELNYIIGTVSDHILIINDERISLWGLAGRNAHVTIFYRIK